MISYTTETASIYSLRQQDAQKYTDAQREAAKKNFFDKKTNGFLSKKTARDVTKRVSNLLEIAAAGGRTVTFTTLTLSSVQVHSDEDVRRLMLADFIRIIKERYNVVNYIWKAEAQSNGNIHFHILADGRLENVPAMLPTGNFTGEINEIWNNIQGRYGYIDSYKLMIQLKEFRGDLTDEEIKYHRLNNYSQPNSTDVHALYSKSKPEAYINKYIAKPEPNKRKITGRLVGCADSLRYSQTYVETKGDNLAELVALSNMARENPKEVHRIAVVIPQNKKEYLPNDCRDIARFKTDTYSPNIDYSEYTVEPTDQYYKTAAGKPKAPPKAEPNKNIKANFTELPTDKILCIKYYYTKELWQKYAPKQHLHERKKYFDNLADLHYLGVLN